MAIAAKSLPKHFPVYYGWIIVLTVALANFSQTAATHPVLSVLLGPITTEFGWTRTMFTAGITLGTLAGAVAAIFVGRVIDKLGGRWILTVALFVLGLTFVLLAFVQTLWQFYVLQITGRMLAMGVVALVLQVTVPKWFVKKRGIAVALAGLGGMIGNTVTPLYVQWVISMADWRVAAFVAGIVVWVISVLPVAFFMRRRPEDMGLLPDGALPGTPATRDSGKTPSSEENSLTLAQAARVPAFYLLGAAFTLLFLVGPGMTFHLLPYLEGKGLTPSQGVWVLALWSVSGALGALVAGAATSQLGARRALSGAFLFMALGLGFLMLVNSFPAGLVWAVYMGMLIGGIFNTLYQVILADYFGRESLGRINGAIWPVEMLTNAAGPLVAAMVFDSVGNYYPVFTFFAIVLVGCAALTFLAKPPSRAAVASTTP